MCIRDRIKNALDQGVDYTTNQPFKLRHPESIPPGEICFTGNKVLLMFPWGGSHADQFAAMICDNFDSNGIVSMGTTMGGYSNTWEWPDNLKPPGWAKGIDIEWNVGHTIRPNGQVLEGNPSRARIWVPMTAANASGYFEHLIDLAEQHLSLIHI